MPEHVGAPVGEHTMLVAILFPIGLMAVLGLLLLAVGAPVAAVVPAAIAGLIAALLVSVTIARRLSREAKSDGRS
jgi:membrane protein implicated in regulation of membrane protease activity